MKTIVFTQDFDGNLPIFKNKKIGEKMEVNEDNAKSLILRGIAELDETVEVKELKSTVKTKEEKHKVKTK